MTGNAKGGTQWETKAAKRTKTGPETEGRQTSKRSEREEGQTTEKRTEIIMAEDKKDNIGGIPSSYWRYIAALAIASVVIFAWNSLFNFGPPPHYTINYSQFMEQLSAGNIKSVSIKKLLVSGSWLKK